MPQPATASNVRFAAFDLDLETGELRRRGVRVPLHDKPFQVLKALVEHPGNLVSRQELQRRLWSEDTFVDFDNNLNAAVKRLRDTLGDSAESPRFIETLPRKGYRFVAPVEPVVPENGAAAAVDGAPSDQRRAVRPWRTLIAFIAVAVVAYSQWSRPAVRNTAPTTPVKTMLAVLPFENLDADASRDYFADGMTEEMITQLGRLAPERLGVIARTSAMAYKGTRKTIGQVGQELGVDYVLEGSVRSARPVRGGGDAVRITAQLIAVSDQTHLWAETYDRATGDILSVQREIAVRVAGTLALELLPGQPAAHARASTASTAAYESYLRGRAEWSRFDDDAHRQAIAHFERALELDPAFAHAWAGLADAYNLLGFGGLPRGEAFPKAVEAAERALALDRNLAMAHNSLAFARLYYDWDFEASEASFRRALELDPNYAMAYHWYTGLLSALGRHDEAIAACRKALELDPVSLSVKADLGWYLIYADRYDDAIEECRRTLDQDGGYGTALACLQEAYVQKGRWSEAVEILKKRGGIDGVPMDGDPQAVMQRAWERNLQRLAAADQAGNGHPLALALAYARLGQVEPALAGIERAIAERDGWAIFLRVFPQLDALDGEARFEELAGQVGL